MTELDLILETARDWHEDGVEFALATVVAVRGSTYRGLGARQLLAADGAGVGTVSGGCLDNDLRAVALQVMETGGARLVEFDLTADDEAVWGWGIGCNGATELLVEPAAPVIDLVTQLEGVERPVAIIHYLSDDRLGRRDLIQPSDAAGEMSQILALGENARARVEGRPAMIEVIGQPRSLVVCGAGHDAAPLVELASRLGYETTVVDDRRQFLSPSRFPDAARLVRCEPRELAVKVELGTTTAVVVMTHNYLRDLGFLEALIDTGVGYIGLLGPGDRLSRLLADLAEEGIQPAPSDLAVIHGPAGLDLGAEGPTEIAWSILSEILAVRRGAGGGFLRSRKGPTALAGYDREPEIPREEAAS